MYINDHGRETGRALRVCRVLGASCTGGHASNQNEKRKLQRDWPLSWVSKAPM